MKDSVLYMVADLCEQDRFALDFKNFARITDINKFSFLIYQIFTCIIDILF